MSRNFETASYRWGEVCTKRCGYEARARLSRTQESCQPPSISIGGADHQSVDRSSRVCHCSNPPAPPDCQPSSSRRSVQLTLGSRDVLAGGRKDSLRGGGPLKVPPPNKAALKECLKPNSSWGKVSPERLSANLPKVTAQP